MEDRERRRLLDEEHLRLLRICYFISGGATAFWALFPLMYVFMGVFMSATLSEVPREPGEPDPRIIGYIFAAMGGVISLIGFGLAALKLLAARALGRRRSRALCFVVAGVSCLGIPFGTALGVFTFIVLARPSLTILFGEHDTRSPPAGGPHE